MKSLLRALALVACAVLSLQPTYAQAKSGDEAAIRQWLASFIKAFEARDVNATMAFYSPEVVAYDLVPPLQYVGRDAYRKDFETFFSGFKGPLHMETRDLHILTSGNLAVIETLYRVSGTQASNGQPTNMWIRNTSVLRRTNGRWLDVHDHVSVPADMDTGKALLDLKP
ncbi:MAG TPA: nuclear transport factor 2 family protein [Acidobacteriaceae bacterium]|nr:nuclear transport factor 2 family protein [Acidobacteriaceae bacterium]